jgi:hypothetical protein
MDAKLFIPNLTVAEALQQGQVVARVFGEKKTACVGCYLMQFCTLEDVARTYSLHLDEFLDELQQAIHTKIQTYQGAKNETAV